MPLILKSMLKDKGYVLVVLLVGVIPVKETDSCKAFLRYK